MGMMLPAPLTRRRPNRRSLLALVVCLPLTVLSGACGGSSSSKSLTVFAASSLTGGFTQLKAVYEKQHPGWTVSLDFAGSDTLAAQIEQGAPVDVYAAASPKYPQALQAKKLLGATTNFATNTLVLVVPASNPAHIADVSDITKGARVVIGDPSVPLGAYTETVLGTLGLTDAQLNIASRQPDAKSVIAPIALGEADAGFVYVTDALAAGSKVKQIPLPASARATATYPIGIVTGTKNEEAAQQWIDLVTGPKGQAILTGLGFGAKRVA